MNGSLKDDFNPQLEFPNLKVNWKEGDLQMEAVTVLKCSGPTYLWRSFLTLKAKTEMSSTITSHQGTYILRYPHRKCVLAWTAACWLYQATNVTPLFGPMRAFTREIITCICSTQLTFKVPGLMSCLVPAKDLHFVERNTCKHLGNQLRVRSDEQPCLCTVGRYVNARIVYTVPATHDSKLSGG